MVIMLDVSCYGMPLSVGFVAWCLFAASAVANLKNCSVNFLNAQRINKEVMQDICSSRD